MSSPKLFLQVWSPNNTPFDTTQCTTRTAHRFVAHFGTRVCAVPLAYLALSDARQQRPALAGIRSAVLRAVKTACGDRVSQSSNLTAARTDAQPSAIQLYLAMQGISLGFKRKPDNVFQLDPRRREWLLSASSCDYHTLVRLLREDPDLYRFEVRSDAVKLLRRCASVHRPCSLIFASGSWLSAAPKCPTLAVTPSSTY